MANGTAVEGCKLDVRAVQFNALALIGLLSSVAPDGTRIGQIQCRSGESWPHLTEIEDFFNHVHIDFAYTGQPLNITS
ncbi:hypothetical protein PlfCFBP13513_14785 [Plantibacter flavus]|uniref:hypothetical protein n=1 Tax=Plantibacter TaxID=190323 RepID=UPI0010C1A6C5|nr:MULTISPECIES: hypothetical protein [Plantibacter]MBD8103763.1 hypothetical protein [Plantibacter sp. CFBP 8775]MBD8467212.1 hypothetical protein [Plantibacter sp. CFBP 8798]MBD8516385.1 hypothetical protein [Plantibacter sp. CFBP 8804]TKJ96695.1 hypothetical protein PlfCFBP13513_14785 [Plantibacter flavus]